MSESPGRTDYSALLQRAHDTIEGLQARLAAAHSARREPIAIVGMGLRFPGGAVDAESFWRVLHDGLDVVTEVPPERWDVDAFYDPDPDVVGKTYSRWGAFLDGIDLFDPHFFGISPREAAGMDPQQRLLLEVAWEALENAGQASPALVGSRSGVFVGMVASDYAHLPGERIHEVDAYFGTGISRSIAAGRLAYAFGLQGPAIAIDTACSSSAVATHLACLSLRAGECDRAIAGGVNVMLIPGGTISASRARMLSPTGRCHAFDAAADGYVRAEGCAMLVLKRLSDAVADGDEIHSVILGSAVNQDGRSNGITAPNAQAQELLLRAALADAGLQPGELSLLEAHGTGTSLGDPIEMRALAAVFGDSHTKDEPLMVGSVKTNIGHTEGVAGTAGLIKLVLALRHGVVPPHLHLREPNPHIPWERLPFTIPTSPTAWPANGRRRVAGVSSFGFSGTNSHIIVAEPPPRQPVQGRTSRPARVLPVSARTEPALRELAVRHAGHLARLPESEFADAVHTAGTGRTHHAERLAVVAGSAEDGRETLAAWTAGERADGVLRGTVSGDGPPEVAFLFTGQGAQYVGMGRELYETEPVFRAALDRCDTLLRPLLEPLPALSTKREERPLLSVLYPSAGDAEAAARLIHQTAYTQPALFSVEYALAQLWRSWGIEPSLVMGHSVGEFVAACVAGVFSLEDGLKLIAARGRLMQALPAGGAMATVFADEATVAAAVAPHAGEAAIAAINGPRSIVVSGAGEAVRAILARLAEDGVRSRPLTVSHAFHSPLMEPVLDAFAEVAATVSYAAPRIGLVSNVSGRLAGDEVATSAYWRRHVLAPVRFLDAVRSLREAGCTAFLEAGPAPTLIGMAQRCLDEAGDAEQPIWLASLRPGRGDALQAHESLAALYVHGADVDWSAVGREPGPRRVPLPTYPFQRQRYWADFGKLRVAERPRLHPLLDERLRSPLIAGALFQARVGLERPDYLSDHRIFDAPLFPATGFVEMVCAAARTAFGGAPALEQVQLRDALVLPDEGEATLQVTLTEPEDGFARFEVYGQRAETDTWTLHVAGRVRLGDEVAAVEAADSLERLRERCSEEFPVAAFYERLAEIGVGYGPAFRGLHDVRRRDGEAVARIELPDTAARSAGEYQLHPGLLDACLQLLGAAVPGASDPTAAEHVYIPVELGSYRLLRPGARSLWCHARLERPDAPGAVLAGRLRLFDERGESVAEVAGVHLRRVERAAIEKLRGPASAKRIGEWLHTLEWQPASWVEPRAGWAPGRWLILADEGGVGDRVAERIEAEGGFTIVVRAGDIGPVEPSAIAALLTATADDQRGPLRGAVHLWSLDEAEIDGADALMAEQKRICGSTLALVQALASVGAEAAALVLVTRGAQRLPGDAHPPAAERFSLWGLANAATLEHPELACRCLDLDPDSAFDAVGAVVAELAAADSEDRVAVRTRGRHVARLARHAASSGSRDEVPAELVSTERGILDNLVLRPAPRRAPGAGEVEVRVRASGLNFRDVLNALGMYPGDAGPLGSECSGVVVAVGEGVDGVRVGDAVVALTGGAFRSHVVAPVTSVYRKPPELGFADAAGIPIAFLTAWYGLHDLAGLQAGDRVLIHAAAGGVGLAAVQLAQRAGAEVFGTAGSAEKHAFLRSIGVRHVMSSRTLDFADEVKRLTCGAGVNVVLNALADDFIPASLSVLADGGCFLEIGKRGIWSAERVAELNPTLRYHAYDLGDAMRADQGWFAATLDRLVPQFVAGALRPPPLQSFPLEQAADAFRFMAQAKHTGKIVLTQDSPAAGSGEIHGDATYLVTGGLGGLGLKVARWLVGRGARSLVLMGRNEPAPDARRVVGELEAAGASVTVFQGDVGEEADVKRMLAEIAASLPPLRGVVHAAGVIDDGMLQQQTWQRLEAVMRPKVLGGWLLDAHTRGLPIDFFVLFSTGSALLGSAGQGNYSAANAFLDGLAHRRRSHGLAATTINWGAWSEVGMAAGLSGRDRERWREHGLGMISPAEGVRALERILEDGAAQVAVLPFDWSRFVRQAGAGGDRPLFERLATVGANEEAAGHAASTPDLLRQLESAEPRERYEMLSAHVHERVKRVLGLDAAARLQPQQGLSDLGMDSLMAVELSNHLQTSLGRKLPSTLAFEHPTLAALTEYLASEILGTANGEAPNPPEQANGRSADAIRHAAVADLSDEEAEDTLLQELDRAGY